MSASEWVESYRRDWKERHPGYGVGVAFPTLYGESDLRAAFDAGRSRALAEATEAVESLSAMEADNTPNKFWLPVDDVLAALAAVTGEPQ